MTRTGSRPFRAMRGAMVVLAVAAAWRAPTIERAFAAAVATGDNGGTVDGHGEVHGDAQGNAHGASRATVAIIAVAMPRSAVAGRQSASPVRGNEAARMIAVAGPVRASGRSAHPVSVAREATADTAVAAAIVPADRAAVAPSSADAGRPTIVSHSGALATAAYERLAAGDRRDAVRLLDAALGEAGAGDDLRAPAWRRQRDALSRRWSASAYSILRGDSGSGSGSGSAAVTPVLGGGQSGVALAYAPDPLARRPLALTLRGSVAHDDSGRTGFAAVGVAWRPLPAVSVAAERLIAVGPAARGDWTVRVAAGADRAAGRFRLDAYAEAGIVGRAAYAAGQARVGRTIADGGVDLVPGVGGWASVQHDRGRDVDRLDVGPGLVVRAGPLAIALDYRFRVAGNAAPGSGPVATLSAAF